MEAIARLEAIPIRFPASTASTAAWIFVRPFLDLRLTKGVCHCSARGPGQKPCASGKEQSCREPQRAAESRREPQRAAEPRGRPARDSQLTLMSEQPRPYKPRVPKRASKYGTLPGLWLGLRSKITNNGSIYLISPSNHTTSRGFRSRML